MNGDWCPFGGERTQKAWQAGLRALADGEWHWWQTVVEVMVATGEIQAKTANNLLYAGCKEVFQYSRVLGQTKGRRWVKGARIIRLRPEGDDRFKLRFGSVKPERVTA